MTTFTARQPRFFAGMTAAALLLSPIALTARASAPVPAATTATGTYNIDKPHTDISFTVTHLAITKVHGRFNDFDGTVKVDGKKPENSSVEFAIKAASIDTGNAQRDTHLKSKDFFDVEKFPEITFKSTRVAKKGSGYVAAGTLTMHGVSKPVALPFTVAGPIKGIEGGTHLGVSTALDVKRSEFGVSAYPGAVGDVVSISIELDLLKAGSVPPTKTASR